MVDRDRHERVKLYRIPAERIEEELTAIIAEPTNRILHIGAPRLPCSLAIWTVLVQQPNPDYVPVW